MTEQDYLIQELLKELPDWRVCDRISLMLMTNRYIWVIHLIDRPIIV